MSADFEDYDRVQLATEAEERARSAQETEYSLRRGAFILQIVSEGKDIAFTEVIRSLGQDSPEAALHILEAAVKNIELAARTQGGLGRAAQESADFIRRH